MKIAYLLSTAADYSEASLEDAWNQAHKPGQYSITVGVLVASSARYIKLNGKVPYILVNPDWTSQWLLTSQYCNIFSESAG